MHPPKILVVFCTAPESDANRIMSSVVNEQLAACANLVGPVRSIYRWNGELQDSSEVLCILKTTEAGFAALEARIRELHPYEVPEIIALPVSAGFPGYLAWVAESSLPAS